MTREPDTKILPILQQDPDATPEAVARALLRPIKPPPRIVRESLPAEYTAAERDKEDSPPGPAESADKAPD